MARVFSMKNATFASYLRGNYGTTNLNQKPFEDSSGIATSSFESKYGPLMGYEFGFAKVSGRVTTRFGLEIVSPTKLKDIKGKNSAEAQLFSASSELSAYIPKISMEFAIKQWPRSRIFFGGEYGVATLTLTNIYDFTTAGTTQFGIPNYREELKATTSSYGGSLGWEFLMTDTTTMVLEGGYRFLNVQEFKHNVDAVTIPEGAVTKGTVALDNNGAPRVLNMNGVYIAAMFKIWIY